MADLIYHPLVASVEVTLKKRAKNFKDGMADYHEWNVKYVLKDGKTFSETIHGQKDEVERVCALYGPDDESFTKLCLEAGLEE